MPSNNWTKNHAKVTVYLDYDFYTRLQTWSKSQGYSSISSAINSILQQHIDNDLPSSAVPDSILKRIEQLEIDRHTLLNLTAHISELESQITLMRSELIKAGMEAIDYKHQGIPIFHLNIPVSPDDQQKGITKTELCSRVGLSVSTINNYAEILKIDPDEYLYIRTKWKRQGEGNKAKYFPPEPAI